MKRNRNNSSSKNEYAKVKTNNIKYALNMVNKNHSNMPDSAESNTG